MQIISTKGRVLPIKKVVPVVEQMVSLNGQNFLLMTQAKNLSVKPTALALEINESSHDTFGCSINPEIVLGNLKPEKVIEVLKTLNEKGSYDFSSFTMQKAKKVEQLIIDGGKSAAYSSEAFDSFNLGMHRLSADSIYSVPFIINNGLFFDPISDCSATEGMEELAVLDEGSYDDEEGLDE